MYIKQIYTDCLAQASYYVESNNEAIIIDPIRDSSRYINLLKERNTNLKYIFETHFHADFVSGHVELASLTNAHIVFGPAAATSYNAIIAEDNQEFSCGNLIFRIIHTPGHTLESVCYLLSLQDVPKAVFTGDTLFIGEVGRPDLAVNPELKSSDLAKTLYHSLHSKLMNLPDDVIVYPGHGAGSACGKNISLDKQSTIGLQKKFNYALQPMSEDQFVELVLNGILPAPNYFKHDVMMNKNGYDPVSSVLAKSLKKLSVSKVIEAVNEGAIILDVRLPNNFEKGFIPGSINIGKTGMFAPWVGTMISVDVRVVLVCNNGDEQEVISRLARIGYENIIGYTNGVEDWEKENQKVDTISSIYSSNIKEYMIDSIFLDVRNKNELESGYIKDSINIPLNVLEDQLNQIKKSDNLLIYCAGGYRSMIASSLLKSKGYKNIKNIYGGFNSISKNRDSLDYVKIS